MTRRLQRAIAEAEKLPAEDQDAIVTRLLAEVEDERQWTARFASTTDSQWDCLVAEVAETSKKRARCRLTTFSRLMSHSSELGRHRGIPRPAELAPRLGASAGVPRLCLVASRPSSPEPPVQEGEPAPADLENLGQDDRVKPEGRSASCRW